MAHFSLDVYTFHRVTVSTSSAPGCPGLRRGGEWRVPSLCLVIVLVTDLGGLAGAARLSGGLFSGTALAKSNWSHERNRQAKPKRKRKRVRGKSNGGDRLVGPSR